MIGLISIFSIVIGFGCTGAGSISGSQSGADNGTVQEGKALPSTAQNLAGKDGTEGSQDNGAMRPVIDRIEVLMRSGLESENLTIYEPQRDIEPPRIEIKALYTAEISCVARSLTGAPLEYHWSATGGKIFGNGKKITWLAPQAPLIYRVTCRVSDGRSSSSATINISVRCCY